MLRVKVEKPGLTCDFRELTTAALARIFPYMKSASPVSFHHKRCCPEHPPQQPRTSLVNATGLKPPSEHISGGLTERKESLTQGGEYGHRHLPPLYRRCSRSGHVSTALEMNQSSWSHSCKVIDTKPLNPYCGCVNISKCSSQPHFLLLTEPVSPQHLEARSS